MRVRQTGFEKDRNRITMKNLLLSACGMLLLAVARSDMDVSDCGAEVTECEAKGNEVVPFYMCMEEEQDLKNCSEKHKEARNLLVHCGYALHYCGKTGQLMDLQDQIEGDICVAKGAACLFEEKVTEFFLCLEESKRNKNGCMGRYKKGYSRFTQCAVDFWLCSKPEEVAAADDADNELEI